MDRNINLVSSFVCKFILSTPSWFLWAYIDLFFCRWILILTGTFLEGLDRVFYSSTLPYVIMKTRVKRSKAVNEFSLCWKLISSFIFPFSFTGLIHCNSWSCRQDISVLVKSWTVKTYIVPIDELTSIIVRKNTLWIQ